MASATFCFALLCWMFRVEKGQLGTVYTISLNFPFSDSNWSWYLSALIELSRGDGSIFPSVSSPVYLYLS